MINPAAGRRDPCHIRITTASGATAFDGYLPGERVLQIIRMLYTIKEEEETKTRKRPSSDSPKKEK